MLRKSAKLMRENFVPCFLLCYDLKCVSKKELDEIGLNYQRYFFVPAIVYIINLKKQISLTMPL